MAGGGRTSLHGTDCDRGVVPLLRALCRARALDVTVGGEDRSQPRRRVSVGGPVGEPIGAHGAGQIAALLQQCPEVEGAVLIAAPLSTPITGLRRTHLPSRLVQDTEVQGRARVAERVGFAVGEFGNARIAALFKQHAEPELLSGGTRAVRRVHAPRHLPAFPNHPCHTASTHPVD
ncbi:MAG TPA: hypothetical protein VGF68_08560 [Solirubrobacteraceae bacterium]|jgi:hypothetical protein